MKTGSYIFAKHPDGSHLYPAKVSRVARKFLWYIDDLGNLVKIAKTSCVTQNQWRVSNVDGCKAARLSGLGQPMDGYKTYIDTCGQLVEFIGRGWIVVGDAKESDYQEYPLICNSF